jgi:hypothetical protein
VWYARVLLRELRERSYTGGYTLLTDWLRRQREAARTVEGGRLWTKFQNGIRRFDQKTCVQES